MKYFGGEINGMKLSDFNLSDLSTLDKYEERLQMLANVLDKNGEEFLNGYFSNYYNVSPNMDDELASEDAVCGMLDIFGTYLLSAKDIESERKVEYKFWKSMRDFRKSDEYKKQLNESSMSNGEEGDSRNEVIDMFVDKKSKNYKKPKDMKIVAKDLKNPHINQLDLAIKYVKSEIGAKNIKKHLLDSLEVVGNERERAIINRVLSSYDNYMKKYVASMREDQIIIKKAESKPIQFDNCLSDSGFPTDWEKVDIENRKVFVILLESLSQRDIMDEDGIGIVAYDLFYHLMNKMSLSEREREIVKFFGNGMEQKKIADYLGITKSTMQVYINRVHVKLVKTGYKLT